MSKLLKLTIDYGPLISFFAAYKLSGMMMATIVIMATSFVAVILSYIFTKKVPFMVLASAVIIGVFGGITLLSGDTSFIKMKPTLLYLLFAGILGVGLIRRRGWLSYILDKAITMSDYAWYQFSMRWALFFVSLAILNEVIWRNFSEDFWVQFKVFGFFGLTLLFLITQYPFLKKHQVITQGK